MKLLFNLNKIERRKEDEKDEQVGCKGCDGQDDGDGILYTIARLETSQGDL